MIKTLAIGAFYLVCMTGTVANSAVSNPFGTLENVAFTLDICGTWSAIDGAVDYASKLAQKMNAFCGYRV